MLYNKRIKEILESKSMFTKIISNVYNFIFFNKKKIKGKNNRINISGSFFKNTSITVIGNNNSIVFKNLCYVQNTKITIYGDNNVINISDKVFIKDGDIYLEDNENILKIDTRTIIAGKTHIAITEGKQVSIGNRCMFSNNVVIRTGDSHSIIDNITQQRINNAKNVKIGNHVWVTQNVTILKGSQISDDSIVATGSVVTKKFENNNIIIGGNPSKKIKDNINWKQERI